MKNHGIKRLISTLLIFNLVLTTEAGPSFLTAEALLQNDLTEDTSANISATAMNTDSVAGATVILGMDIAKDYVEMTNIVRSNTNESTEVTDENADKLVMAKVNQYCNMRETPDSNGKVLGRMYDSCGGIMLDSVEGWTKVRSGEVIGWVDNRFLRFGDEARQFAVEVGTEIVVVDINALNVRKEPKISADVLGVLSAGEKAVFVGETAEWSIIEYDDGVAYVQSQYLHHDLAIDEGETIKAITLRESKELYTRLNKDKEPYEATQEEIDLLAALVQKEAVGESFEGKVAVVNVVLNRVRSTKFPNTIYEVVYAPNQFTPATNGAVDKLLANGGANEACYEAVYAALGGRCTVGDYLYFRRKGNKSGYILGNHVFY